MTKSTWGRLKTRYRSRRCNDRRSRFPRTGSRLLRLAFRRRLELVELLLGVLAPLVQLQRLRERLGGELLVAALEVGLAEAVLGVRRLRMLGGVEPEQRD